MPEGDTIHRAARTLDRAMRGATVVSFESDIATLRERDRDTPLTGRTIERIDAVGKHLLMHFSGDLVLRTHMRMNGSWHIYRKGETWQRPRRDARVVLSTADWVAVGFRIPVAEFLTGGDVERNRPLRSLGPDLLAERDTVAEAVSRALQQSDRDVAEVLLDQKVAAGIGNVYKSEVLFLEGIVPFRDAANVTEPEWQRLYETSRRLLRENVRPLDERLRPGWGGRRTTGRMSESERLWVYGRGGKPCRRCGKEIHYAKTGPGARPTYWCPSCQT